MHLFFSTFSKRQDADVLILPFWKEKKQAVAAFAERDFLSDYALAIGSGDFQGKEGETLFLYVSGQREKRLLLLGLGEKKEHTDEQIRRAYAAATKACIVKRLHQASVLAPVGAKPLCALEGMCLANYAYDHHKKVSLEEAPSSLLKKIQFLNVEKKDPLLHCQRVMHAVYFVRDLVNGNADEVTPDKLCSSAKELPSPVNVRILRKKELVKEKMGLLLAVSRASQSEPALIVMRYQGNPKSKETTAIVGKGITYDTGGLNLKPTGSMETMKCDMAGAAVVLGVLEAAATTKLKANLIGVIATCENAIGPQSYKPGDVYMSHAGKTVEISNTDAEGRLVLADALSYLQETYSPTRIIDLATLTGGVVIALGEEVTGLFSNDDALAKDLFEAGEVCGERLWRLPVYDVYKESLKSTIADIKNSGPRKATAINGAMFLKEFIKKKTSWAHLDIAGTAYQTAATGVGVRLLMEYLAR